MKEKFKLTALEKSWILYDIGNSAFILLATALLPIYFQSLVSGTSAESNYMTYWSFAGSFSAILVALLAPILGAMADRGRLKKPLYLAFMLLGCLGCAGLGVAGTWLAFLLIYIVSKVGFNGSLVFYDSMLTEVATPERMDMVSSLGYALGYIGSIIPFIACLIVVLMYESFGITQGTAMVIAFVLTAVWWLVCSLPLSRRYKQTAYAENGDKSLFAGFRQLWSTLKKAKKEKHIFLYLVAFFFFINGVYTIIDMATAYGTELGLDSTGLLLALLVTQIVAFPFAILFGKLAGKYDTGLLIKICIGAYTCITLFAIFLASLWQFWTLAVLVGMFQGGIQAMSRSYLGKIIPPEQSGEYYGLMDICGKGASFLGMGIVGLVKLAMQDYVINLGFVTIGGANVAVGALVVLFIIGYVLFDKADKLNKQRQKAE